MLVSGSAPRVNVLFRRSSPRDRPTGIQPPTTSSTCWPTPHIRQVAWRLVDARLPPEGHAVVVAMIEQVRRLEVAAGTRRRDAERLTGD